VKPVAKKSQEPLQVVAGEVRRSSAADEESGDGSWELEGSQLDFQGLQVVADEMVLACHQREIAIAAAVGAEGNVNVGGRREFGLIRHSLILAGPALLMEVD
jgi:hypothetical protein